MGVKLGVSP